MRDAACNQWFSERSRNAQFRKTLAYPFERRGAHIDVSEHRALRTFLRMLAHVAANHRTRHLLGLDNRVTVGSAAEGRSSSKAINNE